MPIISTRPARATGALRVRRSSWAAGVSTTKSGLAPRSRICCQVPWTRKASPKPQGALGQVAVQGQAPPPDGQHLQAVVLAELDLGQGPAGHAGTGRQRDLDDADLVGLEARPGDVLLQLDVAERQQLADAGGFARPPAAGPRRGSCVRSPTAGSISPPRMMPAMVSPISSPIWLSRTVVPTRPEPAWIRTRNICSRRSGRCSGPTRAADQAVRRPARIRLRPA